MDWQAESIHEVLASTVEQFEVGFAKVAQPIRIAVTGGVVSPAIDQSLALLGKQVVIERLRQANKFYQEI